MLLNSQVRPLDQSAISRSTVLAAAREEDGAGRRVAADTIAHSSAGGGAGRGCEYGPCS
jgi:hypothetical protein